MQWQKDGFTITTDRSKLDLAYIHDYLSRQSYWAQGIPVAVVQASLEGSECFGVFEGVPQGVVEGGAGGGLRQIGLARVITDKATFGYLADVFVDETYRGRGLSKWLMETILAHPELQGFRNWFLATRDAHGLYAQFGFRQLEQPETIMRKADPDVYTRSSAGV